MTESVRPGKKTLPSDCPVSRTWHQARRDTWGPGAGDLPGVGPSGVSARPGQEAGARSPGPHGAPDCPDLPQARPGPRSPHPAGRRALASLEAGPKPQPHAPPPPSRRPSCRCGKWGRRGRGGALGEQGGGGTGAFGRSWRLRKDRPVFCAGPAPHVPGIGVKERAQLSETKSQVSAARAVT